MAVAKPKDNLDGYGGAKSPQPSLGVPTTDRHVDIGQRTAKPPVVSDETVDLTTAGPNDSGVTNTRGLRQFEADRYKPRG